MWVTSGSPGTSSQRPSPTLRQRFASTSGQRLRPSSSGRPRVVSSSSFISGVSQTSWRARTTPIMPFIMWWCTWQWNTKSPFNR